MKLVLSRGPAGLFLTALLSTALCPSGVPVALAQPIEAGAGRISFGATRASSEIVVDGALDEQAWQDAVRIPLPWEWFPGDNAPAPVETICQVTYDDRQLYIEDFAWDAIWETAARITDDGYLVELAIPFNQLRVPRGAGAQTWGIDVFRSWPRSVRHRVSSSQRDRNRSCFLCQVHKIEGLEGVSPGRNLELIPTLTGLRSERAAAPGRPLERDRQEADPGLTVRWGITPNLVLSAAANPDFSQVEADTAQLAVNERFALFFPEKRPFFLEGVDSFATPLNAVFTRSVADPAAGLKLTGKLGPDLVGLFLTRDRVNNLTLPSNQFSELTSLEDDTDGGVFRYRRDVGSGSTLGALGTLRQADGGYYNRLYGGDGFLRLGATDTVAFQYLHSDTRYPEAVARDFEQPLGGFGGDAWLVDYQHYARRWNWAARWEDLGPGFRADSGFIPRVDVRTASAWLTRVVRGSGGWLSQLDLGIDARRSEDSAGRLTDQRLGGWLRYSGPLQSEIYLDAFREKTLFAGESFDLDRVASASTCARAATCACSCPAAWDRRSTSPSPGARACCGCSRRSSTGSAGTWSCSSATSDSSSSWTGGACSAPT